MKSGRESENFRKIFHVEQLFRIWRQNSQYRKNIQIVPEKHKKHSRKRRIHRASAILAIFLFHVKQFA